VRAIFALLLDRADESPVTKSDSEAATANARKHQSENPSPEYYHLEPLNLQRISDNPLRFSRFDKPVQIALHCRAGGRLGFLLLLLGTSQRQLPEG
jgi:hypothetical protein